MRALVVGGGGLGTVLAGFLGRAGVEVTLFVKPEQAARFDEQRVAISGLDTFDAPVQVAHAGAALGAFDYLILTVKGRDTETALAPLTDLAAGTVLSLQNGVRKDERLAALFGRERVAGALSFTGGTVLRPGHARYTLTGPTLVGELDGGVSERCTRLVEVFREAGLPAEAVPDILNREWHKLAIFLRTAMICALVHTDIASAILHPDLFPVCLAVSREVQAVAAATGYPIDSHPVWFGGDTVFGDGDEQVRLALCAVAEGLREHGAPTFPSLAQDAMAGRPTELEDTGGDVLARAERLGIATPHLATCVRLLRALGHG